MAVESIPKTLLENTPDFMAINAAIEEFKANKPITQRSSKTGQLMVMQEDKELGVFVVISDGRVVYHSRAARLDSGIA